ncbi:MAG: DUF924 family protein [Casimicrobiaceae bacterium]
MQDEILTFWFGEEPGPEREVWFRQDDAFDAAIHARFADAIATALTGGFGDWTSTPRGALARIILLDQFTRNAFRDTPRAFAGDDQALAAARDAVGRGFAGLLTLVERWFLYMPFQHAEDRDTQARSVVLFTDLAGAGLPGPLEYARRHAEVIARFGRFPHRNAILGRPSTPDEIAFLREPGSRF